MPRESTHTMLALGAARIACVTSERLLLGALNKQQFLWALWYHIRDWVTQKLKPAAETAGSYPNGTLRHDSNSNVRARFVQGRQPLSTCCIAGWAEDPPTTKSDYRRYVEMKWLVEAGSEPKGPSTPI